MADAVIYHLLLQKHLHVILLHHKRQLEVGDVEGQILRVEDAQHVDLLRDLLNTALQLSHTLLIASMLPDDVLNDLLADTNLLIEIDILES